MKVSLVIALLFASALAAPSFTSQYELDGGDRRGGSIIDRLREDKRFSRFVSALDKERGLKDELEQGTNSLFAPTNDAMKKMEDEWSERDEGNRPDLRDVIRYHIAPKCALDFESMHAGLLIPTGLRIKALGDRHQRLRLFSFGSQIWVNMRASVEEEISTDNGRIFAIDAVLLPPSTVTEMVNVLPSRFSTFALALERTGLAREIEREKELTVLAPTNAAWEALGMENNRYLFSCAGQQTDKGDWDSLDEKDRGRATCAGKKDLERIIKQHISDRALYYSSDIMSKRTVNMPTMGKQEVKICAKRRGDERRNRDEDKHHNVNNFNFVVNEGEARVVFTDMLASNGAIHAINSVLTEGVNLPHDRCEINM